MAGFRIYSSSQVKRLSKSQRKTLSDAVSHQIRTTPAIRRMLKSKTAAVYKKMTTKKPKAGARRKK